MKRLHTIALASATGIAVLVPSHAYAGGYTHTDPAGDVLSQANGGAETKAPDRAEGDVISSAVRHLPRRVVVTLKYRELSQTPDLAAHVIRFRTNERKVRDVTLIAGKGNWTGKASMARPNGDTVKCRIASHIDYSGNWAQMSVPRRCLSQPRWVRIGGGMVSLQGQTSYGDDALTNGVLGNNPVLGPKVFRG